MPGVTRCLKARSHGAMWDCVYLSHGMGCVDVNGAIHMVRLRYIFVCNVRYHIWMGCVPILCDCNYVYSKSQCHIAPCERALLELVHTVILCECDCNFLLRFCETVTMVRLQFIYFVWIAHCNHTEWVWNPFMCDVTHTNATVIIAVAPYEQYDWHPHNPFFNHSRIHKEHRVNEPLKFALVHKRW